MSFDSVKTRPKRNAGLVGSGIYPHYPVLNPNKVWKVRRVLDGASKFPGQSLNSALLTGPVLLQCVLHLILRFCQNPCAVSADIEGPLLQVTVPIEDQPTVCVLWRAYPLNEVKICQFTRHVFGAKDSPRCANYALQRTAGENLSDFPHASVAVQQKYYMADYLDSVESTLLIGARDLMDLLKRGGFKPTKFGSNVPRFCRSSKAKLATTV